MTSQNTPEEILPALKTSTERLEVELIEDLNKHAEKTFSHTSAIIDRALAALKPLEKSLDEADRLLEESVQDAHHAAQEAVRAAVNDVDVPLEKLAEDPPAQCEARDANRRGRKQATRS